MTLETEKPAHAFSPCGLTFGFPPPYSQTLCVRSSGFEFNNQGVTPMQRLCLRIVAGVLALGMGQQIMSEEVKLEVGANAPEFVSKDDAGKEWKSSDHIGQKIVVVYFYPADLTGGCTKQACGFRDDMAKLQQAGVEVVGVSGDSVENHKVFKADRKLNFTLLADETGEVAQKFGVPVEIGEKIAKVKNSDGQELSLTRKATAKRWTFVIGKDGKVAYKNTMVQAAEDSQTIAAVVAKLK